jgi:hypothetical protein
VSRQQLRGWLAGSPKGINLDAVDAGRPVIGEQTLLLSEAQASADGSVTHRWRLREHATGWHTTLVVRAVDDAPTWVWLEVEHVPAPGTDKVLAHVPGLARLLLGALDGRDGLAALRPRPQLVRTEAHVDELIDVLCDPDRRLPAIVASPYPKESFEDWQQVIENATRYTAGLASTFVLAPDVVDQFNETFGGDTHWVAGGAVRTYLPIVDPADPTDAARHRVLSAQRLQADPRRAAALMAVLPRMIAVNTPLPSALARLPVAFRSSDEGTTASNLLDDGALDELLDEAGRNVEEANAEAAALQEQVFDLAVDLETAEDELARKTSQVLWLQRQLVQAGRPADAYGFADAQATVLPTSFSELIDRLGELPHIEFTGDPAKALDLDQHLTGSTWAQVAWNGLLALNDFAAACADGKFDGNFAAWCARTPQGAHGFPVGKLGSAERQTVRTMPKMREPRVLPVPPAVHPSGRVFMGEHLKLSRYRTVAPRLHYYRDARATGKVYVGYIGRHLPNTKTN